MKASVVIFIVLTDALSLCVAMNREHFTMNNLKKETLTASTNMAEMLEKDAATKIQQKYPDRPFTIYKPSTLFTENELFEAIISAAVHEKNATKPTYLTIVKKGNNDSQITEEKDNNEDFGHGNKVLKEGLAQDLQADLKNKDVSEIRGIDIDLEGNNAKKYATVATKKVSKPLEITAYELKESDDSATIKIHPDCFDKEKKSQHLITLTGNRIEETIVKKIINKQYPDSTYKVYKNGTILVHSRMSPTINIVSDLLSQENKLSKNMEEYKENATIKEFLEQSLLFDVATELNVSSDNVRIILNKDRNRADYALVYDQKSDTVKQYNFANNNNGFTHNNIDVSATAFFSKERWFPSAVTVKARELKIQGQQYAQLQAMLDKEEKRLIIEYETTGNKAYIEQLSQQSHSYEGDTLLIKMPEISKERSYELKDLAKRSSLIKELKGKSLEDLKKLSPNEVKSWRLYFKTHAANMNASLKKFRARYTWMQPAVAILVVAAIIGIVIDKTQN